MKKVMASILAATMALGFCACGNTETTTEPLATTEITTGSTTDPTANPLWVEATDGFDDKNIVLQFASISDVHVARNSGAPNVVKNALNILKETALLYTDKGLDAVVIAGDLTDAYTADKATKEKEAKSFASVYESVFDPNEVPALYALGNHDHDFLSTGNPGSSLQEFMNYIGNKEAHTQYDVECSDSANGSRHAVINGYHFFFVEPTTYVCNGADDTGAKYSAATKAWLDAELAKLTAENPNQYIFLVSHPMVYNTVYGSELLTSGIYWYTKDLTSTLDKYPQVVTFGGHLHFPINDERSIMSTKFTSLGCGSVQYMAIENGNYEDMSSATVMKDNAEVSSGYLAQVDKNGNVRFIRLDFTRKASIKTPWVLETPSADGAHLAKYSANRADTNKAPVLPEDAISITDNASTDADAIFAKVTWKAGTDDDVIHHYVLTVKDGDRIMETSCKKVLADYYRNPQVSQMKTEYSYDLGTGVFDRGSKYTFELVAYDTWGAESNKVVYTYEPKLDITGATVPDTYIDIDFAGGAATVAKGPATIELAGAAVADTAVNHKGVSKTLPTLNVTEAGQYAKLTLTEFGDNFDFQNMIKKNGITIEAVYVNRSKSGTQGIVSGFEKYGIGISEKAGKPAFTAYVGSALQTAEFTTAASSEELVHVLAVYSRSTSANSIAVYVNGEKVSTVVSGTLKVQETNHNVLYLGANCTAKGEANNQTTNLSIVDVKVYAEKFTHAQAIVRYNQFVEEFSK